MALDDYKDLAERIEHHQAEFDAGRGFVEGPILIWSDKEGRLRMDRLDTTEVTDARKQRLAVISSQVEAAQTAFRLVESWAHHHTGPTGARELARCAAALEKAQELLGKEYDRG